MLGPAHLIGILALLAAHAPRLSASECTVNCQPDVSILLASKPEYKLGYYKAHAAAIWRVRMGTEQLHENAYRFLDRVAVSKKRDGTVTIRFADGSFLCSFNKSEAISCPEDKVESRWRLHPVGINRFQIEQGGRCAEAGFSNSLELRRCSTNSSQIFAFSDEPEPPGPNYLDMFGESEKRVVNNLDRLYEQVRRYKSYYNYNYHPTLHKFKTNPHVGTTGFRSPVFSLQAHYLHNRDFYPLAYKKPR